MKEDKLMAYVAHAGIALTAAASESRFKLDTGVPKKSPSPQIPSKQKSRKIRGKKARTNRGGKR